MKWKLNTPGRRLRLKILALCWVYSAIRWVKGLAFPLGIGLEGLIDFLLLWFWRMVILGLLKICLGLRQWGSVLVWRASRWCTVVYQSTNWFLCRLLRFVHHERFLSACSLSWSTGGGSRLLFTFCFNIVNKGAFRAPMNSLLYVWLLPRLTRGQKSRLEC